MSDEIDDDLHSNEDADGWENWEPEYDDEGNVINLGSNVRDPFKERLARDE